MIIKFTFENYRSFRKVQEFSLVANSSKDRAESLIPCSAVDHGLLRSAAIYGANASGKSNVLRALQFFVDAIRKSHRQWNPSKKIFTQPFALSKKRNETSSFTLDFIVAGIPYQYAFAVSPDQFEREWLYSYPNGRKQMWYERKAAQPISFGAHLTGPNKIVEDVTRKNSLFLSAAAQNNHPMLSPIFEWLSTNINILFDTNTRSNVANREAMRDLPRQKRIAQILKHADLGIVDLSIETQPTDEKMLEMIKEVFAKMSEYIPPPEEGFKLPTQTDTLKLVHSAEGGATVDFDPMHESAGTLTFLSLIPPTLEAIETGGVLCVDELDSNLHPLLALELVKLFNDSKFNQTGAQFIFNTHNVNLLDSDVLRRDQVWFTEKSSLGESHLYALSDFKPKLNENLKRGYLQGRFGAIPFFGSFPFSQTDEG